jgi:hypothetical protein
MTMVFCRGCGKEIHSSAPLCPHCGAPQASATPPSKAEHPGWMAITSLGIALFSLLCVFGIDDLDKDQIAGAATFALISIVFGAINLQQKRPGKTMAIIAIVLASLSLLICIGNYS